jgi:hypothetical protein
MQMMTIAVIMILMMLPMRTAIYVPAPTWVVSTREDVGDVGDGEDGAAVTDKERLKPECVME